MEKETPGCRTIEEVSRFLGIPPQKMIKNLTFMKPKKKLWLPWSGETVRLTETKLLNTLGCIRLEMAGADTVLRVSGAPIGFAGPVGLKNCKIIADPEVVQITNAVTGANKNNYHLLNVNIQRDYHVHTVSDIRMVQAGEPCPRCASPLVEAKGIEVGQIFKLGDKYSKVLGANYLDENGRSQPIIMGCYGIGVTRTMAAAIEQNHDKDGDHLAGLHRTL